MEMCRLHLVNVTGPNHYQRRWALLYNRLLRLITVACVVSSPKCLWVVCRSMQCFKCGKYFILTESNWIYDDMQYESAAQYHQSKLSASYSLPILVCVLLLTKNKNNTLLNTLSMACNNASLFISVLGIYRKGEDMTSWDRWSWKNSQLIFWLLLNSRGFTPAIRSGSCVLYC